VLLALGGGASIAGILCFSSAVVSADEAQRIVDRYNHERRLVRGVAPIAFAHGGGLAVTGAF
jgi:hypothetical protein